MNQNTEVDLESGVATTSQGAQNHDTHGRNGKQAKFFAKFCGRYVGGSMKDEERPLWNIEEMKISNNEANSNGVTSVTVDGLKNRLFDGQESGDHAERIAVKEKCKKVSKIKPPKPPRPPKGPSLDAADQKLVKEITELAMLKRARIERMKALKKMKASKASSSSGTSIIAMVFTITFFLVILIQGVLSGRSSRVEFPRITCIIRSK